MSKSISYDVTNPNTFQLNADFNPFVGANHCIINIFCLHCKHCGINSRFRLWSDKEKEAERFYTYHKTCKSKEF